MAIAYQVSAFAYQGLGEFAYQGVTSPPPPPPPPPTPAGGGAGSPVPVGHEPRRLSARRRREAALLRRPEQPFVRYNADQLRRLWIDATREESPGRRIGPDDRAAPGSSVPPPILPQPDQAAAAPSSEIDIAAIRAREIETGLMLIDLRAKLLHALMQRDEDEVLALLLLLE